MNTLNDFYFVICTSVDEDGHGGVITWPRPFEHIADAKAAIAEERVSAFDDSIKDPLPPLVWIDLDDSALTNVDGEGESWHIKRLNAEEAKAILHFEKHINDEPEGDIEDLPMYTFMPQMTGHGHTPQHAWIHACATLLDDTEGLTNLMPDWKKDGEVLPDESKRERVKDILRDHFVEDGSDNDAAYEMACDLADSIFATLNITANDQDKP